MGMTFGAGKQERFMQHHSLQTNRRYGSFQAGFTSK